MDSGHFYESGRQDLNLRPLGPEPDEGDSLRVARSRSRSQGLEVAAVHHGAAAVEASGATPGGAGLVASLSHRKRPRTALTDPLPEQLLNVREVALALGVCRATVYRLCQEGKLSHVRVGDSIRFHAVNLAMFAGSDAGRLSPGTRRRRQSTEP